MFATTVHGRVRSIGLALVVLVALVGALLAAVAAPQAARAEVTGTGGQYVPMTTNARVFDGATSAGAYTTVQVAGKAVCPLRESVQ